MNVGLLLRLNDMLMLPAGVVWLFRRGREETGEIISMDGPGRWSLAD